MGPYSQDAHDAAVALGGLVLAALMVALLALAVAL